MPKTLLRQWIRLLLDDLQDLHGAGLGADAAGDALGGGSILVLHDQTEGASLGALAAAGAELLVDHVHAGLGVLGDGALLAGTHALAALHTGIHLDGAVLFNDLDAGLIGIEFLVESVGASTDALQTSHTSFALLNSQFFHGNTLQIF